MNAGEWLIGEWLIGEWLIGVKANDAFNRLTI
jgi:hypothetical protein